MLMVMPGGLLMLAVFVLVRRPWGHDLAGAGFAARLFIPARPVIACAGLRVGVSRAGCTVRQELPILAANFALPATLPAALAALLSRQLARI